MVSRRLSRLEGHRRKFMAVFDGTPECEKEVHYAGRRAKNSNGGLVLLYVIPEGDFQQWLGVEQIIVSQTSELRRQLAREFGATSTIDPRAESLPERVHEMTEARGADCVLVCTPAPSAFREALHAAALGGRINFFAGLPSGRGEISLDANLVHYRELVVTGSTANTTQDCVDALELLLADPEPYARIVSHTSPLRDIAAAMASMAAGESLKAMVQP